MEKTENRKIKTLKRQRVIWSIITFIACVAGTLFARLRITKNLDLTPLIIIVLLGMSTFMGYWIYCLFSISISTQERREKQIAENERKAKKLTEIFYKKIVHVNLFHDKDIIESKILEQAEGMFYMYYWATMNDDRDIVINIKNENHDTIGKSIVIKNLSYFWDNFDFEGKNE